MDELDRGALSYDYLKRIEGGKGGYELARSFETLLRNYAAMEGNRPASFIDYLAGEVAKTYGRPLPVLPIETAANIREVTDEHRLPALLSGDGSLNALSAQPVQHTLFPDTAGMTPASA